MSGRVPARWLPDRILRRPRTSTPHDNLPEARVLHDEIVAAHPSAHFVRLADGKAVLVRGDHVEVVDSPPVA